jgi:hypothetical protein
VTAGSVAVRALLVLGGVVVLAFAACAVQRATRSEEARVSELVDQARDDLVAGRERFLDRFAPDVVYRGRLDHAALARDFQRWREAGYLQAVVAEREVEVEGDTARVALVVDVLSGLRDLGRHSVRLVARKVDGEWRVVELSWQ